MSTIITNYQWIDEPEPLSKLVKMCDDECYYPIDTEFERSRTYDMNPALLQVMIENTAYLVDLLDKELAPVMFRAMNKVVLHSGSEDLCLWSQLTGSLPEALFDTQVAAAICGYGLHYSYQNLVKDLLNIELSKTMSRSDWLQRPLTDAQIHYAIEDIVYLTELKSQLSIQMQERGLKPLFDVLMSQQLAQVTVDTHIEKLFQKVVKSERLNLSGQQRLWALLQWREEQAIRRNKPRNWILNPQQLIAIVLKVKNKTDLFNQHIHPQMLKIHADDIMTVLYQAAQIDSTVLPKIIKLTSGQGEALKAMKEELKVKADHLDIDQTLIINVMGLKELAFNEGHLTDLATWRALP